MRATRCLVRRRQQTCCPLSLIPAALQLYANPKPSGDVKVVRPVVPASHRFTTATNHPIAAAAHITTTRCFLINEDPTGRPTRLLRERLSCACRSRCRFWRWPRWPEPSMTTTTAVNNRSLSETLLRVNWRTIRVRWFPRVAEPTWPRKWESIPQTGKLSWWAWANALTLASSIARWRAWSDKSPSALASMRQAIRLTGYSSWCAGVSSPKTPTCLAWSCLTVIRFRTAISSRRWAGVRVAGSLK